MSTSLRKPGEAVIEVRDLCNRFGSRACTNTSTLMCTKAKSWEWLAAPVPVNRYCCAALSACVKTTDGGQVRLSSLARVEERQAQLAISHIGQFVVARHRHALVVVPGTHRRAV